MKVFGGRKKSKTSHERHGPGVRRPHLGDESASMSQYHYRGRGSQPNQRDTERQAGSRKRTSQRSRWQLLPSYAAGLGIVVAFIYVTILYGAPIDVRSQLNMGSGDLTGFPAAIRPDEYESFVADYFQQNKLQASKLTLRTDQLAAQLASAHPEIAEVDIRLSLVGRGLSVIVTPEQVRVVAIADNDSWHGLNDRGKSVGVINASDTLGYDIPIIRQAAGIDYVVGERLLPQQSIAFIAEVDRQYSLSGESIEYISLPAVANELHVRIAGDRFIAKYDINSSPRVQVGMFIATRRQLKADSSTTPQEYIDVRVSERAYIR